MDRRPVQTYVLEHDNGILTDAMRRELRRGGQVYYLHNRVETIERCAAGIQMRIPEARVGFAHGKMSEDQLSDIWRQLLEHEIDILVCTTIIETGVDVPQRQYPDHRKRRPVRPSQLHQLRGRVGRSARRAFAYLTFVRGKGAHRRGLQAAGGHPGIHGIRRGLQDRHAGHGDPGRGQSAGRPAARPYGGGRV